MRMPYVQAEVGLRCAPAASGRGRRSYQKPRIIARESLRAFAALCSPGKGRPRRLPVHRAS
jgi:hypothetical protein